MAKPTRRYNLRKTKKKPQGVLLQQWQVEYTKLMKAENRRIPLETVGSAIRSAFEDSGIEQWRITLKCPLSQQRIKVPARYADCTHVECFDLETFLQMKIKKNFLVCPICQKEVEKPMTNLRIDEYIETMLSTLPDAIQVELNPDGSFTEVHEESIIANVIDDEEPFVQEVKREVLEESDEYVTLSDSVDESMEELEIVDIKPISLMPLNMDIKPKITLSSEPEQIHSGENKVIQLAEYRRLKSQFEKKSLEQSKTLENKRQEQETDRNALEYENSRLTMQEDRIKQKVTKIEREKRNIENLKDTERQQLEKLKTGKTDLIQLEKEVRDSKQRLDEVSKQLGDTTKQISDAQGESADTERAKRQLEAIASLKRVFPEKVYGRLVDLCQPSHRKFQIAVTKVLGKFMIAIVCDSDETARDCITYLREQHYPPETFLPLTALDVHPVNEKLREITNPANVKLIFDVINCNVQSARKALQFACGNSLVCETPEHARQLAYGTGRFRAVALDGTQFQPNGVISGGGFDLKVRAKKWDEQATRKLKEKRFALQEELSELHRTRRRELDVEMKRQQLNSLEHRSKFTRVEYRKLEDQVLQGLNIELEAAIAEIEVIQDKIRNLEAVMKERSSEIDKLKKQYDRIPDEIYAEFSIYCQLKTELKLAKVSIVELTIKNEKLADELSAKMAECERVSNLYKESLTSPLQNGRKIFTNFPGPSSNMTAAKSNIIDLTVGIDLTTIDSDDEMSPSCSKKKRKLK